MSDEDLQTEVRECSASGAFSASGCLLSRTPYRCWRACLWSEPPTCSCQLFSLILELDRKRQMPSCQISYHLSCQSVNAWRDHPSKVESPLHIDHYPISDGLDAPHIAI